MTMKDRRGEPLTDTPRAVLDPDHLHVGRSLRRTLARGGFELGWNRCFPRVIRATGTSGQIDELAAIGWLEPEQATALQDTMRVLREEKLMAALVSELQADEVETRATAELFARRLGPGR